MCKGSTVCDGALCEYSAAGVPGVTTGESSEGIG